MKYDFKYHCRKEVEYLNAIVTPFNRKPKVYTRFRRHNTPKSVIKANLYANIREPDEWGYSAFTKEEADRHLKNIDENREECYNCKSCRWIPIKEEEE